MSDLAATPPRKFRPVPYPYHHELELTIESLTNLGSGVARDPSVPHPEHDGEEKDRGGWVVMVPFALPGERVRARVYRNYAGHSDADLLEVLEPSSDRVDPPCQLFGQCGGCQYQHLSYPAQLAWKRDQVADLLLRMADLEVAVEDVAPSPLEYGYRSKITPHYQRPRSGAIGEIGFLRHGQRSRLVDVPACPIASDAINAALPSIRESARQSSRDRKKGATLLLRDSSGTVLTEAGEVAEDQVGDLTFRFLAGDFFQNNPSALPAFTEHVTEETSAGGTRFLVDAYCGSGLFGLCAAGRFEQVAGVEISATSADWARQNARANGIENATFYAGSAEEIFDQIEFPAEETAVIIDPPRKGCDAGFLGQLFELNPARVVYVSCNPSTQIRDLKAFSEAGYRVTRVRPFDLFPQTRHLECVATLERS